MEEKFREPFYFENLYGMQTFLEANNLIIVDENLGSKIGRTKMGSKFFWKQTLWKQILGSKFWRSKFFWEQVFGEEIKEQKFWGAFFASKISFWEGKNIGEQKCFGEERYGEQKFWEQIFHILGSKNFVCDALYLFKFHGNIFDCFKVKQQTQFLY